MRYTKKDFQKMLEHVACYLIQDAAQRSQKIGKYLDKDKKIVPGTNEMETTFREIMVEDYSALTQTYAVVLQPLFKYLDKEMPRVKEQLEPLKTLYQVILDRGSFKDGCKCIGCKKCAPKDKK